MRLTGFIRSQNQNVITPPLTETDGGLTNHFHSLLQSAPLTLTLQTTQRFLYYKLQHNKNFASHVFIHKDLFAIKSIDR